MARIRTIKPEFFTSEDIVALSPLARLLYIALWCESDKDGRMVWKPKTFKMRYFPADDCQIEVLCQELVDGGLVVLYGEGYAHIPAFKDHQHINPRETESKIAAPEVDALTTRQHASARVNDASARDSDAQGGREGKGREHTTRDASHEPPGFVSFWNAWPVTDRKQAKGKCLDAWKKASAERDAAVILSHVGRLMAGEEWRKDDGQFIPAPLVYLNQRRWEGAEILPIRGAVMAGAI